MDYLATVVWDKGASVRPYPNTAGTPIATLAKGSVFKIDEVVRDSTDPDNPQKLWGKISANNSNYVGRFVALHYPSSSGDYVRCVWDEVDPPTNPPGEVILTHVIEVYSDGSIKVDGQPI